MTDFIFIHINKCGGTSLKQSFSGIKNLLIPINDNIVNLVNKDKWNNAFKFTVVRNPYDRILSLCGMLMRDGKHGNISNIIDMILEVVSDDSIKYKMNNGGLMKGTKPYIKRHGLPMTHTHYGVYNKETNSLNIDKYFKLETINEEWGNIESLIGKKLNLYNYNTSNIKKDHSVFTKEQIQKINKIYHKDFEIFGYNKINL